MTDTNLQSKIEALNQPLFDLKKNDVLVSGQKKIVQFITDTATATFDNHNQPKSAESVGEILRPRIL